MMEKRVTYIPKKKVLFHGILHLLTNVFNFKTCNSLDALRIENLAYDRSRETEVTRKLAVDSSECSVILRRRRKSTMRITASHIPYSLPK